MNEWGLSHLSATEIMTSAICPLNCRYCYIPKAKEMEQIHQKIIEKLKSGEYLESIKKFQGNEIEHMGFWGTEPLLTLPILGEQMNKIATEFPKLTHISFSTSLMLSPIIIIEYLKMVEAVPNRKFTIDIQISVDGPDFITDKNRVKGAAQLVKTNYLELIRLTSDLQLKNTKVKYKWKPTIDVDNMKELLTGVNIERYVDYFKSLNEIFYNNNKSKNVSIIDNYVPTIAVPGKYTTEDGKVFARYIREMHRAGMQTAYSYRLDRLLKFEPVILKKRQLTCSGGDSNFAVEDFVHICHRSLYLNDENYVNAVLNSHSTLGDIDNWDISLFERESIDFIKKNYIVDPNNKIDKDRFVYTMRGFHDFWALDVGYVIAMAKELALVGQADEEFLKNEDYCVLFALFVLIAIGCPMENLLNTGSLHLTPVSLIRMFGNGAFKELLKIKRDSNELPR